MRKVAGYLGQLDNDYGQGAIPKDIIKQAWDCIQCIKGNSLPLFGIVLSVIGVSLSIGNLMGVI